MQSKKPNMYADCSRPIAVFDSGVGGLTVLKKMRELMPDEDFVYLGDTARVPYGIKSVSTIRRFAAELAAYLMQFDPKLVVAACNTAASAGLEHLRGQTAAKVVGVIEPGAAGACRATRSGRIGIVATESTVLSRVYERSILEVIPEAKVYQVPCPILVPLAEEGRDDRDRLVFLAVREYISHFYDKHIDTLVLGCTHYPLFKKAISRALGSGIKIVDSAIETAMAVKRLLKEERLLAHAGGKGDLRLIATDNPERFRSIGANFLGCGIAEVEAADIAEIVRGSTPLS